MARKPGKTERRVATRIEAVRPKPTVPPPWSLLTMRVLAVLGLLVSGYLTVLHVQAGTSGVIDSPFCSVSSTINCNAVLGSVYARLFDIPIAGWAAVTYAALLLVSFLGQPALLVLFCGWTFVFSLYMAWISWFVIKAACLFCMTLYAVNLGLLVSAVAFARAAMPLTGQQAGFAALGYLVIIIGFGWWQAQTVPLVAEENVPIVAAAPTAVDADFLRYYNARPVVSLNGQERYTEGPVGAPLTISEFADFRCPQCARAREVFKQLLRGNPNDLRVIFHHYPLDSSCNPHLTQQVHPTSCAAAIAAECAGDQGRFWEYADLLFADQKEYTEADLKEFAKTVNLDTERFQTCLAGPQVKERIRRDVEEAERIGVKATPTLIANGRLIEGLPTPQKLASLVTIEKQRAGRK